MKFFKKFKHNFFLFILLASIVSCMKDEATICIITPGSTNLIINGKSSNVQSAQYDTSNGKNNDIIHAFQIEVTDIKCTTSTSLSFKISVAKGETIGGTYSIKSISNSVVGDATGSFAESKLNSAPQTLKELKSGTIEVTKNGNNNFTLDLNAKTINGIIVKMAGTRQF